MKVNTPDHIISELNIEEPIFNIYPYGSRIYGTHSKDSDFDYILVSKGAMLNNGSFRNNAISNKDRTIQGILYSRSGFLSAIDNYDIGALECISLPMELAIQLKMEFGIRKWQSDDLVKKIIEKSSTSFYAAKNHLKRGLEIKSKKGIFHSIRIIMFGQQLKSNNIISDYTVANELYSIIINDKNFNPYKYVNTLKDETKKLKEI